MLQVIGIRQGVVFEQLFTDARLAIQTVKKLELEGFTVKIGQIRKVDIC